MDFARTESLFFFARNIIKEKTSSEAAPDINLAMTEAVEKSSISTVKNPRFLVL
jgi:hypothetical protein